MSLHRVDKNSDDNIDHLIRWALHDSVAGAEPSPQVWERIQQGITGQAEASTASALVWYKALLRRLSLRWPARAGASFPVRSTPQSALQQRLPALDMSAPLSVVRIIEGRMPTMRLVS